MIEDPFSKHTDQVIAFLYTSVSRLYFKIRSEYYREMKIKDDGNISNLEFAHAIEMLSSLLKAGVGITEGIKYYQPTISGQLAREFLTLINEEKLGLDQAEIFSNFANRLKTPATHRFVYLILLSFKTGCALADHFDQLAKDIRNESIPTKYDPNLIDLKSSLWEVSSVQDYSPPVSYVLGTDPDFFRKNVYLDFLMDTLLAGKNILLVADESEFQKLFINYFKKIEVIDLETNAISSSLIKLTDKSGKILRINGDSVFSGMNRLKALLAIQEKNMNQLAFRAILNLLYNVPLCISIEFHRNNQAWLSEIAELRAVGEEGQVYVETVFQTIITGVSKEGLIGYFSPVGYVPAIVGKLESRGFSVDRALFNTAKDV